MLGTNKMVKVKDLEEILHINVKKTKKAIGEVEGTLRENFQKLNETDAFVDMGDKRRPNPLYAELTREKYNKTIEREDLVEKRKMFESALKRVDELAMNRQGRNYLEDAEIEVTLSQMVKWGIGEEDIK